LRRAVRRCIIVRLAPQDAESTAAHGERETLRPGLALPALATAFLQAPLSPAPGRSALLGVLCALALAAAALALPRVPRRWQTPAELAAGAALAGLLALATAVSGLGAAATLLAATIVGGLVMSCSIWSTAVTGAALVGALVGLVGWLAGAAPASALATGLGLALLGATLTIPLTTERRRHAATLRRLNRMQGDLANRQSVEQKLRETHESLERHTIALTDTNKRMEREIEVRRRAEEQALEAARIKDSFLRIVSHELRTPLNAIIGYAEILLDEDPAAPIGKARLDHQKILESARRLLEMIDDILDLSKIEAGKSTVDVEAVDVAELAEHAVAAVAVAAERAGNQIRLKREDALPVVHTDRPKLRRILVNLLDNACKFTHGGVVRLSVQLRREDGRAWILFEVSDTGIGMDAPTLERIFAPFVQADGSTTRRYGGTGLGLAMSWHYATMLGGDIAAKSTPGVGSTFTLRVPATRTDPKASGLIVQSKF
jgi:signal transduction histidine kinase